MITNKRDGLKVPRPPLEVPRPPMSFEERKPRSAVIVGLIFILLLVALSLVLFLRPHFIGFTISDEMANLTSFSQNVDIATDEYLSDSRASTL